MIRVNGTTCILYTVRDRLHFSRYYVFVVRFKCMQYLIVIFTRLGSTSSIYCEIKSMNLLQLVGP